ncbi:MAG: response regulator transcription factor [Ardenticatenaceae bacterium]|nr:response regulator transcription factor [Anaerolineales bacterium]MCB8983499.1 response regulator transcription factor [Ardenticatenaceae bacterium]
MVEHRIRILVVDDHELVRKSIMAMLSREPDMEVVGTAVNGQEAVQLAQTTSPDVIVMDVSLPILDGIRAAGKIRDLNIAVTIIMLSMHYNSTLVQQARKNGAAAYIIKEQANRNLIPAIRAANNGTLSENE